jgi:proteasome lid subunit RPN8/RPN11
VRRSAAGARALLDLDTPVLVSGSVVVATFHTHPNPSAEGWNPAPSLADTQSAWLLDVPCLIRADNGFHHTGPDSRRGALTGHPGFPA